MCTPFVTVTVLLQVCGGHLRVRNQLDRVLLRSCSQPQRNREVLRESVSVVCVYSVPVRTDCDCVALWHFGGVRAVSSWEKIEDGASNNHERATELAEKSAGGLGTSKMIFNFTLGARVGHTYGFNSAMQL